jgi:hypothetical protein
MLTNVIAGFDAASKRAGHDFDPKTDEKITDAARGMFEKATGYDRPLPLPLKLKS